MAGIRFVDTTIRDGHLSLWASGMTTGMMLPAVERLDDAGFEAIEILSDGQMGKAVRELKDDPFERMRLLAESARKTPLRLIAGRIATFEYEPPEAFALFLRLAARNGVAEVRISDPWNEYAGWKRRVEAAHAAGLRVILNLVYSISPVHSDAYYAERCRQAASLGVWRLCFKDPGGLLTPERTRALVPVVLENAGGTTVEFHTHCTTGVGPLCCLEAIAGGMTVVNTALPPLADGSSNPSTFALAANARALGHEPVLDLEALGPVSAHFETVARREGFPIGRPLAFDAAQHRHQVPGGMISNLAFQLRKVGMEDRLADVLDETVRVRAELGYPVMVTPLSQFVGSQAAINVIAGERYREVTDQVIEYALGHYGETAIRTMDPDIRARILGRRRADEVRRRDEPSLDELRERFGGKGMAEEEMMLRWLFGADAVEDQRRAGPPVPYASGRHPLVELVDRLCRRDDRALIAVERPGLALRLERRRAS